MQSFPILHINKTVIRLNVESRCFEFCFQRFRVRVTTQYENTFCITFLRSFDNFVLKEVLSDVVFRDPMIDRGTGTLRDP
jgi:hypothetical protein